MTLLKVVDHYIGHFKYMRTLLIVGCVIIVLVGVGFGYHWYRSSHNQKAHAALAEAIELFDRATRESTASLWDETDRALSQGYSDYSRSSLAPYFLAFQAQVELRRAQNSETGEKARELLQKAVDQMSKGMPFYDMYMIQLARMNLDSGSPKLQEAGHATLREIAQDKESTERGMALYYSGLRFFEMGDREQAVKEWAPLLNEADFMDSLWSQAAQQKLTYQA